MEARKRLTSRLASDRAELCRTAARLAIEDAKTGGERVIACPACRATMRYSISKPLRRVFARCSRDGCLSVSEPFLESER